jgi:hypothetical protein
MLSIYEWELLLPFSYVIFILTLFPIKNACAMWKVLMVHSCDNDILEGLAVTDPLKSLHPLFLS